uniref:Uncharacterized protein n=1 Tax=Meloidogyne enterolobii TaxID=390850 RepID=A0A6V7X0E5_MELEN|nr:unnamed protein product [Meloidogyne enterolobii]
MFYLRNEFQAENYHCFNQSMLVFLKNSTNFGNNKLKEIHAISPNRRRCRFNYSQYFYTPFRSVCNRRTKSCKVLLRDWSVVIII